MIELDKNFWLYSGAFAALLIALVFLLPLFSSLLPKEAPDEDELLNYTFAEHRDLALHIHPYLEIWIDGRNTTVPADIGITWEGMRVIHTHDDRGKIHVESPVPHQFYLKDFFYIWGKRFDRECIFEHCVDAGHTLKVYVNGSESTLYGDIPLKDGDFIKIVYS